MPQFFVKSSDIVEGMVEISGEDFRHLVKVRRVSPGDKIFLRTTDGIGCEAKILSVNSTFLSAIIEKEYSPGTGSVYLTVYLCILKGTNFELSLQKCVETGVSEIIPVLSERTIPDLKGKSEKKTERWRKIVSEAAKQCLRENIPVLGHPLDFKTAVADSAGEIKLLAHPDGNISIKAILREGNPPVSADLFIGPEGGFSRDELKLAEEKGLKIVSAGANHLRAETAAIVIPSIILYEWS